MTAALGQVHKSASALDEMATGDLDEPGAAVPHWPRAVGYRDFGALPHPTEVSADGQRSGLAGDCADPGGGSGRQPSDRDGSAVAQTLTGPRHRPRYWQRD